MNVQFVVRNLLRDRRRSLVTIAAVAVGLGAILLLLSYILFVERAMSRLVIHQDGNGHVQVYLTGGLENLAALPSRYALKPSDQIQIARAIELASKVTVHGVKLHSAQLVGVGMLVNSEKSTGFLARGVEPVADASLREAGGFARGGLESLPSDRADAMLMTEQIAELVGADGGGAILQLSAAAYDGRFNAIEATDVGRFTTGIEAIESSGIKLPLKALQALYDTSDVSRIVIQLADRSDSQLFAQALQNRLEQEAAGRFQVTQWSDPQVGQLYVNFMGFAKTMFAFTGTVLTLIAVATMHHTISANVNDRLREIGVLRAMGYSRAVLTGMFVWESVLLATAGAVLALIVVHALAVFGPSFDTELPRMLTKVPVKLALPAAVSVFVAATVVACMGLAAWWTARRVTRRATVRPGPFMLARLVAAAIAGMAIFNLAPSEAIAASPDSQTMAAWLARADLARGGGASYSWISKVQSVDGSESTQSTYAVAVRDGRALVRVLTPARQAGEKILLDGRAMWYGKKGLRKPVSVSPQQRLTGEASNGDVAAVHYSRDYEATFVGEVAVEGRACYELKLVARNGRVTYDAIRYFIDKQSLLGVRAEFLTASGSVFKVASFEYGNKVKMRHGEAPFVSRMHIVNATFPDRYSEITYSDVTPAEHPDSLFHIDELLSP